MSGLEDSDPKVLPRSIPEITKTGEGGTIKIGQDDLVQREKKRMGDYLAYQTQTVYKNEFPIEGGSRPFRLRTATGNPAPISDVDGNAVRTYMDTLSVHGEGQRARSHFENLSDSGMLDTDTRFLIKKGKSDDNKKTGTEYLREIDEKLGEAEIPQRVQRAMLDNNRFNASNPSYIPGQKEGEGNSLGSLIVQPSLGVHVPQRWPKKVEGNGGNFVSIPIEKLKQFGLAMMLEASGEINVPTDLSDPNQLLGAAGSAMVPGLARLGQKVPITRFDGVKLLNAIEPTFGKQLRDATLGGKPVESYGNVNNPLVPFAGLGATSSVASAALLSLSVALMIKTLHVTLDTFDQVAKQLTGQGFMGTTSRTISQDRRLRLGNYYGKQDESAVYRKYRDNISLNLVDTRYAYFECVEKGIEMFFDAETPGQAGLGATINVQQSAGFYNVVFRNLVRSTTDMFLGLAKTITGEKSAFDVDPNLGGSGNQGIDTFQSAAGFVALMNESKLLKFMNVLAIMGESAFNTEDGGDFGNLDEIVDMDPADLSTPKIGVLHTKSRLSDEFGNRLAWAGNTVKSMYLLPAGVITAASRFDGNTSRFSSMTSARGFRRQDRNRISQEEVKGMEDYLEADYMPFYFHDLRTNEIISFHAFLELISDSYTVDYNESDGYGRSGKVLTYKNTNRSINLSFTILATGSEDYDEMWYKINKFITLLYPQYTEGRVLKLGQDSFVQPFSQIPAASPLIRLRLGDILKSNYNKFNLARIFGLSSPDFFLQSSEQREQNQSQQQEADIDRHRVAVQRRMSAGDWQVNDVAKLNGEYFITKLQEGTTSVRVRSRRQLVRPRGDAEIKVLERNFSIVGQLGGQRTRPGTSLVGFAFEYKDPQGDAEQGRFAAGSESLLISPEEVERQAQQLAQGGSTNSSEQTTSSEEQNQDREAIQGFFETEGAEANPVFKSFESVRGRGLAGFIRSFNMDIEPNVPWETLGLNNRAPKMVKVSIQFEPIHDLPPGLDHNGYNIAPVYNVGNWLKQSTHEGDLPARQSSYERGTKITRGNNESGGGNQ